MNNNYIAIGKIVSSYGLKGEIKVILYNETSNILKKNIDVWLLFENKFTSFIIDYVKPYNKFKLIKFKSINSLTDLELLNINSFLYVFRSDFPKTDKENFYLIDLVGFSVESDNLVVGKVIDIIVLPTNNSMLILSNNNCEFMIPILDEFIELFDFDNNKIIVKNSEVFIK